VSPCGATPGDLEPGPGNKADITTENSEAITLAKQNNHTEVVNYLESALNLSLSYPLSKQALLKAREKYSPAKLLSNFLEKNLESIVESLCMEQDCVLRFEIKKLFSNVERIVVEWLKNPKIKVQSRKKGCGFMYEICINPTHILSYTSPEATQEE